MTPSEAKIIYDAIFEAFPYMSQYLKASPTPQATIDTWKKMILPLDFSHTSAAIDKWKSGEVEPPDKPWEMGMLPLKLRAVASKIADAAAKAEKLRETQQHTRERLVDRPRSKVGRLCKASLIAGGLRRDGVISDERNREIVADLKRQVFLAGDEVVLPPEVREFMHHARREE
jgi:hypothetical protein